MPQPRPSALLAQDDVPIPNEILVRVLACLDDTLSDPNATHRETNAAARTLLAFLEYNQATLRALIATEEHEATQPPMADDEPPDSAAPADRTHLDAAEVPRSAAAPEILTVHDPPAMSPGAAPEAAKIPPCAYANLEIPPDGKPAVMIVAEARAFVCYGGLVLFCVDTRTNLREDVRRLYDRLPPG